MESIISVGPCGGSGGNQWSYVPKGEITQIIIFHGGAFDSIKFKHDNGNGLLEDSKKFGGNGGGQNNKIDINSPSEYLTCISGTVGKYGGHTVIKSLRFVTNLKTSGPFGTQEGTPFSLPIIEGTVLVGFHGQAGTYIDSIGVYLMQKRSVINNDVMKMIDVVPRGAGAWGGCSGKEWDDGIFSVIKQVHVHFGNTTNVIDGLRFEYQKKDGNSVWSPMHGGTGGDIVKQINLDGTSEFIIGISGFYGPVEGSSSFEAIICISFHTNKRTYGPFGIEMGTCFSSTASAGKVVGFHGRNGVYLTAIGVHMEYF